MEKNLGVVFRPRVDPKDLNWSEIVDDSIPYDSDRWKKDRRLIALKKMAKGIY